MRTSPTMATEAQQRFINRVETAKSSGMKQHVALAASAGCGKTFATLKVVRQTVGSVSKAGAPDFACIVLGATHRSIAPFVTQNIRGAVVRTIASFLCTNAKPLPPAGLPFQLVKRLRAPWSAERHFGPKPVTGMGVIVIDEAFAVGADELNAILNVGEQLFPGTGHGRGRRHSFMCVLVGDPLQLPPVSGRTPWASNFWPQGRTGGRTTQLFLLTKTMRFDDSWWFAKAARGLRRPAGHRGRAIADAKLREASARADARRVPHSLPLGKTTRLVWTNAQRTAANEQALGRAEAEGRTIVVEETADDDDDDEGRKKKRRKRAPPRRFYVGGVVILEGRGTIEATDDAGETVQIANLTLARLERGTTSREVVVRVPSMGGRTFTAPAEEGRLPIQQADALTVHALQGETLRPAALGGVDTIVVDCTRLPPDEDLRMAWLYVAITRTHRDLGPEGVLIKNFEPGSVTRKSHSRPASHNDAIATKMLNMYRAHEVASTYGR